MEAAEFAEEEAVVAFTQEVSAENVHQAETQNNIQEEAKRAAEEAAQRQAQAQSQAEA